MELLLIRHAIAEVRDPERWSEDGERPLSRSGQARATRAARGLRRLRIRPEVLLTSPYKRCRQTAAILALAAHWPRPQSCEPLRPGCASSQLLAHLAGYRCERLAIVGHEPELGQLLALCLGEDAPAQRVQFKKLSVIALRFARQPKAGAAQLDWLLPPRLLRALR